MIKVLVVDHHPVIRVGLDLYFKSHPKIQVVGSVGSGIEIFDFVRHNPIDVMITEIDLPELNGITALRAIKKEYQDIKAIVFSAQSEDIYAISTLKAGASAYLSKNVEMKIIEEAIYKVAQGDIYLSNEMAKHLAFNEPKNKVTRHYKKLSTREIEVLKLILSGKKNKDIALELEINEKTVSTYKTRLFKKLNVTNLVELINQAKQLDLV